MAVTEVVFDQINGPRLVILNADGVTTSSLFINSNGQMDLISSGGLSGSNTVDVQSAVSSSYSSFALSASYAPSTPSISASYASTASFVKSAQTSSYFSGSLAIVGTLTASFISASVISASALYTDLFKAAVSTMSVGFLTVTQVIDATSSWANNTKTASYIVADDVDTFANTQNGTGAGGILFSTHFLAATVALVSDFANTVSGTGAVVTMLTSTLGHPGQIQMSTGTTATGRASINTLATAIVIGSGSYIFETMINIPALSSGTQRYTLYVGFGNNVAAGDQVNGIYFQYTDSASTFWQIKTAAASTRTTTTTTSTVNTGWDKLKIIVTGTTSAEFFVNDVSVGTINTNIPTVATGLLIKMEKSVGTTTSVVQSDYIKLAYT